MLLGIFNQFHQDDVFFLVVFRIVYFVQHKAGYCSTLSVIEDRGHLHLGKTK